MTDKSVHAPAGGNILSSREFNFFHSSCNFAVSGTDLWNTIIELFIFKNYFQAIFYEIDDSVGRVRVPLLFSTIAKSENATSYLFSFWIQRVAIKWSDNGLLIENDFFAILERTWLCRIFDKIIGQLWSNNRY